MSNIYRSTPPEDDLVTNRHPVESHPVSGHAGTSFEDKDARAGTVIWSLAIIGIILVVTFVITVGIQKILEANNPAGNLPSPLAPARIIPPAPQIQAHPWEDLPDLRKHEEEVLSGRTPDAAGHVHIPINAAMDQVVSRLNIEPNAPVGITTPGGGGRQFAGSVNDMPPPYQRPQVRGPQIQGEIRKNAK